MNWKDVGNWLEDNAGTGATLVGSLLTGNIPAAVASGVALVTSATGESKPDKVLQALQTDPASMIKLKELAIQDDENIRKHTEEMVRLQLEDEQKSHGTTQQTVQSGDHADDRLVRWTRPLQSWLSLAFALVYVYRATTAGTIDFEILAALLTLPLSYAGLRQIGKWGMTKHTALASIGGNK